MLSLLEQKQRIIRVAKGEEPADTVLKNADFVNVFSRELCHGDIAVAEGVIAGIGTYSGRVEYDLTGKTVVPGFIDAHIHMESSLLIPTEFSKAVVPHGTTAVVIDPHEIANVCGVAGIAYILRHTQNLPLDVYVMLPSCVPSTAVDEAGAVLEYKDIEPLFSHPRVLGLAEMMNYPGVLSGDTDVLKKIICADQNGCYVDGHAPGLVGSPMQAYAAAGVDSDHECSSQEEALEKLRNGFHIMIREGTAAQNLESMIGLIKHRYSARCMFATDDKHPSDLLEKGHIDYIARRAVALGADPLVAVGLTSFHAAQYFGLQRKGAVSPGYEADLAVVNNLKDFQVSMTFKEGVLVYDGSGPVAVQPPDADPNDACVLNTFRMPRITPQRLEAKGALPLIGMVPGQVITHDLGFAEGVDVQQDILKAAVAERHKNTGHIGLAYLKGYGLRQGAVATSIAHDSHNLIAVGTNDEDIALAMNSVAEMGGGMVVAEGGRVTASLALPIAGLMSDAPIEQVNSILEQVKEQARLQGAAHGIDPFMTLSFISLPVIPTLRLLSQGVFHTEKWAFIPPKE